MKYYFLGIGGVSMSALAMILKSQGNEVLGYDEKASKGTDLLLKNQIAVDFDCLEERIDWADIVVYSSAIKKDNYLFRQAILKGKPLICRGEMLGKIAMQYEKVIAISGAHGKTTTTAMIYEILKIAGKEPTLHLGGYRVEDGKNFCIGQQEFFVTEACEYCDNFLYLFPYVAVVTNIEKEHMDYFKTFEKEVQSFNQFKKQSRYVVGEVEKYRAKNIRHNKKGELIFDIMENNKKIMHLHLKICEDINVQNCIFAYKVCKILKIEDCLIKMGLENYKGVELRFQKAKCPISDNVILDYAHHPTEILKAVHSAKKIYKNKQIFTIFQPHTYSRTKTLLKEFLEVFKNVENPIIFKTYPARENATEGISAENFVKILKNTNKNAKYFDNFNSLKNFLNTLSKDNIVLLFVGAGDLPEILHKNNFIS